MPLIKCYECKKSVSSDASACVKCGAPIGKSLEKAEAEAKANGKKCLLAIVSASILFILFVNHKGGPSLQPTSTSSLVSPSKPVGDATGALQSIEKRVFVRGELTLRDGPSDSHPKRINEKATRFLGETYYQTVDTSVVLKVLENKDDWSKVQVVDPHWLAESHIGWLPTSLLFTDEQKSAAEQKMDLQLSCCGNDAGTLPLLDASKLVKDLRTIGLTEMTVEWKKANFEPGWIAIVMKRWPHPLDRLATRQKFTINPNPAEPNEVNCQIIGPNRDSVSECIVEAELRIKADVRETLLLAAKAMRVIDPSVSNGIVDSFLNQNPKDYGRWAIRKQVYENGEVSVYADYDCSRLLIDDGSVEDRH